MDDYSKLQADIVITVSGGVAECAFIAPSVPKIKILIVDYDIEGTDEELLDCDPDGNWCSIQEITKTIKEAV